MFEQTVVCPRGHEITVGISCGFVEPVVWVELLCPKCELHFEARIETRRTGAAKWSHDWRKRNPEAYKASARKYKLSDKAKLARVKLQERKENANDSAIL